MLDTDIREDLCFFERVLQSVSPTARAYLLGAAKALSAFPACEGDKASGKKPDRPAADGR